MRHVDFGHFVLLWGSSHGWLLSVCHHGPGVGVFVFGVMSTLSHVSLAFVFLLGFGAVVCRSLRVPGHRACGRFRGMHIVDVLSRCCVCVLVVLGIRGL